ncbi:MAG TPA: VWA domain-containing protein [Acidimicrobiales bacterium]|nr:VWA domain-containing protein [Acidimicrobiales bacterium]
MADADRIVTGFASALRGAGLAVPTGSVVLFARALAEVGLADRQRVYWAARATLVYRQEDLAVFDRVFAAYWEDRPVELSPLVTEAVPVVLATDDGEPETGDAPEDAGAEEIQAVRYSVVEILRRRDLSALTADEWAQARRLISALRVSAEERPTRRRRPSRRRTGGSPDLRATMRRNMRRGGAPIDRAWKVPGSRPRRLVFLLDVSGSMDPYARGLALFAHAALASRRVGGVEVFAAGTRLTRITKELRRRDPDAALDAVAGAVEDWSGGTRLGASIRQFNDRWGVRGMARGAIVVICSDGWDRGDPEVVAAEMARLSRVARRVIWVNPLKASPGYEPLARGMAAALPYVDQFVEGHAVASLEDLARVISSGRRQKEPV